LLLSDAAEAATIFVGLSCVAGVLGKDEGEISFVVFIVVFTELAVGDPAAVSVTFRTRLPAVLLLLIELLLLLLLIEDGWVETRPKRDGSSWGMVRFVSISGRDDNKRKITVVTPTYMYFPFVALED
jgi:hypothetical protein